ncbi:MAG TPA: hypothetical protein VJS92_05025 [Candidatus Polarisedimenticolaceae bacterium]|nr:hypothetical protein [Candidatus Polarisedimenticolaceae bacterium]
MRRLDIAGLLLSVASSAFAQHDHARPPAGGPVRLLQDLGQYTHPVRTRSPEAQRFFDQGLRLAYGFNHDEAERAFREAARLDPSCIMAWWGVALVLGPNINWPMDEEHHRAAWAAISEARKLLPQAAEPEAAYVRALAQRYAADPAADRAQLDRVYATAMRELSQRYPDDPDAAVLFAEALMDLRPWHYWRTDGTPEEGTLEIVEVLETVLKRYPAHPGANHYYIHAVEASPHPERALASAERLRTAVPGAGHLVHMPSHIYMRTGDYAQAAQANAMAAKVDEAYIAAENPQGFYPLMYYAHNVHFLAAASAMDGRYADAKQNADKLYAFAAPGTRKMPMAEFFLPTPVYVAARFQRWNELLAFPEPDTSFAATHALWQFGRALAFAAGGKLNEAHAAQQRFEQESPKVASDTPWGTTNVVGNVLRVAQLVLEARLTEAAGDRPKAIALWKQAVEAQDQLTYDEPEIWYYPTRESLGGALLRAGQAAEAERVFRQDLERHPRNARALFGLWRSLQAQQRSPEAAWVEREFQAAWQHADGTLRVEDL